MTSQENSKPHHQHDGGDPNFAEIFHSKGPFCPEKIDNQNNDAETLFIKRLIIENSKEKNLSNLLAGIEKEDPYNYGRSLDKELCWSLREVERTKFLENKRRQHRRDTDESLKNLEKSMRSAYIAKTIVAQNAENKLLRENQKALEKAEDDFLIEKAKFTAAEFMEIQTQMDKKRKAEYKKDLLEQIQGKCKDKEVRHQEYLHDQKAVHEYMVHLEELQRQEILKKKELQLQKKHEMEESLRERAEWLRLNKELEEEENRKIAAQVVSKDDEIRRAKEEKKRIQAAKDAISERIGKEIYALQAEKKARQDFLQDLLVEERQALDDLKHREKNDKDNNDRMIMVATVSQFTAERKAQEQRERALEEKNYLDNIAKAMEEDRKKEEQRAEDKKKKANEITTENTTVLLAKRRDYAAYKTGKITQGQIDQKEVQRKQNVIEEEKRNILKQHYKNLVGFMPPGVLKESDREYLISL